jgi:hypothetical protein
MSWGFDTLLLAISNAKVTINGFSFHHRSNCNRVDKS